MLAEVLSCKMDDDFDEGLGMLFPISKVAPPCGDEEDGAVASRVSDESNMSMTSDTPEGDDNGPKDLSSKWTGVEMFWGSPSTGGLKGISDNQLPKQVKIFFSNIHPKIFFELCLKSRFNANSCFFYEASFRFRVFRVFRVEEKIRLQTYRGRQPSGCGRQLWSLFR